MAQFVTIHTQRSGAALTERALIKTPASLGLTGADVDGAGGCWGLASSFAPMRLEGDSSLSSLTAASIEKSKKKKHCGQEEHRSDDVDRQVRKVHVRSRPARRRGSLGTDQG